MKDYKVCILAAGAGSKLGELTKNVHAGILPVNFKGVLSYIVEKFSNDVEIVVAVGHKKETIEDYLSLAHPEKSFKFVEVNNYLGPSTGPGYSLLQCKPYLQCPFVFFTADTMVLEEIPEPKENWIGIAPVLESEKYCTVKLKNNLICQLDDKIKTDNKFAFIGLAGIKDYDVFWEALDKKEETTRGEVRDITGFKTLIEKKLIPIEFTWFDTGSLENYIETNKNFSGGEKKFDFGKTDEFLYFVGDRVIKYFADPEVTKKRVERAVYLKGLCPDVESHRGNFYSYKKVEGYTLYNVMNSQVLRDFLYWARSKLWIKPVMTDEEMKEFYKICSDFYYAKTIKRINAFHEKNNVLDGENNINGILVPQLKDLLNKVNWDYLCNGSPARFHGDFTVGNILVTRDEKSHLQKFILLDWRHDFGGSTKIGDVYYDLAKLYKGLMLSDELTKDGMFSFDMSGSSVYYDYFLKKGLVDAKETYEQFLLENGYDLQKVRLITAIALLNMSPLHNYPFNFLVYYLGKSMLHKTLIETKQNRELKQEATNG